MSLTNPSPVPSRDHVGEQVASLFLAVTDLESKTLAARDARTRLQRAAANKLHAQERRNDALNAHSANEVREDDARLWTRVEFARWIVETMERHEKDALEDYRLALGRVEAAGRLAGEADSPEAPRGVRLRARRAIATADAFGNKVTMDATLYDDVRRPVLPELTPDVDVETIVLHEAGEVVREVIVDPLEELPATIAETTKAILVPLEDYAEAHGYDAGADPLVHEVRSQEPAGEQDEDENPVCPECRVKKCSACDGTAWDDHEDLRVECSCWTAEHDLTQGGSR
jgi:hypothetical protein